MTEELNHLNTDLKELFVEGKFEDLTKMLDETPHTDSKELISYNYEIIKRYFDNQRYDLLIQFLKFVAFSSFMCDYGTKNNLIERNKYEEMSYVFNEIYNVIENSRK